MFENFKFLLLLLETRFCRKIVIFRRENEAPCSNTKSMFGDKYVKMRTTNLTLQTIQLAIVCLKISVVKISVCNEIWQWLGFWLNPVMIIVANTP